MTRGRRMIVAATAIAVLFTIYEIVTSFLAYTADAYVQSDLITLAPQVTGRIVTIHVTDNSTVKAGDLLASIDPAPFQLAVDQSRAEVAEAKAQIDADQYDVRAVQDTATASESAATYAQANQARLSTLANTQDISRAELDQANDALRRANAARDAARENVARAQSNAAKHQAARSKAEAALADAEWRLAKTNITAPASGIVTGLTLRVGDTAQADVPLIGIIDDRAWRIVANYKESYVRGFSPGDSAWILLDSKPFHPVRAKVVGIARGISRDPAPSKLLAYVPPTTDWIRLQRRFPVTLSLVDPSQDLKLYMGADARVLVLP